MSGTNEMYPYVMEYFERKSLAELGYRFDEAQLYYDQVEAFNIIGSELNKLKEKAAEAERKKAGKGKGRRKR